MLLKGSPQQEAIWDFVLNGTEHGCIDAVAGSGKTTTIIEAIKRVPENTSILVMAFNVTIAAEVKKRLEKLRLDNVNVSTYNAFGWSILRKHCDDIELDEWKLKRIIDDIVPSNVRYSLGQPIKQVVKFLKYTLLPPTPENIENLVDTYDIEILGAFMDRLYQYAPKVLQACEDDTDTADFDDQIWMPVRMELPVPQYDLVFVDEAQDTNGMQQALATNSINMGGHLIVVGDKHQAIYGFRGADFYAIDRMYDFLSKTSEGCKKLPLTVSRRCPKSHIKLAQMKVPHIEAMDDAKEGIINVVSLAKVESLATPGSLIISRVNAPLLPLCYRFLKAGIRARVLGKDEGNKLIQIVKKLNATSMPDLASKLSHWYEMQRQVLAELGDKGLNRLMTLQERYDCLLALMEEVSDVYTLVKSLDSLFDDSKKNEQIILGTVHRTKGLESKNVIILEPGLIPHPMAKTTEARMQEHNLAYVAVTRSLEKLTFVGKMPPAFKGYE